MKRVFSILMLAVLLVSAFGFSASPASAAELITYVDGRFVVGKGVVFVFEASGYRNRDVRGADIFVGSNFHDFGCTVNAERTQIVCVANGNLTRYAGQTGVIYLAGQIFYVIIPARTLPDVSGLACTGSEVIGAYVTFYYGEGEPDTFFIEGDSLEEIEDFVQMEMDSSEGWIIGYEISELDCGNSEISEEIPA